MKKLFYSLAFTCLVTMALPGSQDSHSNRRLAAAAVSIDPSISAPAVKELRALGEQGLQALVSVHSDLLQQSSTGNTPVDLGKWERLKLAMDAVGQQKDCHASKLYWFNNFEWAKAEAAKTGKPILSLRMLGKLDEEFSCANSRFFRTTLYPNPEVSEYLRQNFVLHWESVRPVPKVTIDYGDGRKIERTITGNSIHYVLHSDGTPIDALPGLYSAKAFLKGLSEAQKAASDYRLLATRDLREEFLRTYHQKQLAAVMEQRSSDLTKAGGIASIPTFQPVSNVKAPGAERAANIAFSKSGVERQLVRAVLPASDDQGLGSWIEKQMTDPIWSKVAELHYPDSRLDVNSARLIKAKNPDATAAGNRALTKAFTESPILKVLRNLERSIAEDTVRNEYVLHPEIHRWFINRTTGGSIHELNRRVYAELFLTPDSDPWLGLVPPDTFSALQNDGLVNAQR